MITPNRKEAFGACGNINPKASTEEVARKLIDKIKCQAVLMTLGEEGMLLAQKSGTMTQIPTAAKEVYDVSGAGDTVIAAFALAMSAGATLPEAAFISNLAAGVVVGKLGTATVNRTELQASFSGLKTV